MKFDYVIGNPPYQEESDSISETNGQKPRKNIFHHFQLQADEISTLSSILIYPGGRWIHQSGKGLKSFGLEQINDKRLSVLSFFPDSKDIFGASADLSDGISIVVKRQKKTTNGFTYIYHQKNESRKLQVDNPGNELIPLNPLDFNILNKIKSFVLKYNLNYLHDSILPRSLFGIESDFVEKNPDQVKEYNPTTPFDKRSEIKLFSNDKAGKAGRAKWYIANKKIIKTNKEYITKWKVVVSSANAGGQKRDNQIEIIDNLSAFGRSRVALAAFETKREAENFFKYATSYIIRYAFLMNDEALSTLALKVPDLGNYEQNNLLDFHKDIDKQMTRLMDLSEEEFAYIKETVDNLR